MPVEHRPPGNQRKIARAFDQRIAPARHVDGAGETPFDPLVEPRLDKGLCEFLGKLAGDTRQFTPLKRRDHAAPIGETAILRSEEQTSELQSLMRNSYAVFCLKKKTNSQKH